MRPFLKTAVTVTVTAAVTFGATSFLFAFGNVNPNSGHESSLQRKINTINTYIENNYLYDDYSTDDMDEEAVKAYVKALDEPYTQYYTAKEFESYLSDVEESYVGIGVVIAADTENDKIVVVSPIEGSPAQEAGMKPGDCIVSVEGKSFSGSELNECVNAIKNGKEGTSVKVTVERENEKIDFDIVRKEIVSESVRSEMLDDNIGYVRITSFNTNQRNSEENTFTEFKEQTESLKKNGMEKMIIDLRDNPGGVLDVVCDIADYLLPEGIITYTETRLGEKNEYRSDKNELNIPIVVLVNGNSASASEILTGALRDYERAVVVGEKSYGKGIVQSVYPFSDGSGMSMTIAKYYSPNGVCIHGVGIEPDYAVSLPEEYSDWYVAEVPQEKDTQLSKAIEILTAD